VRDGPGAGGSYSAVNVALPDLAKDPQTGDRDLSWTITSYSRVFRCVL
jgi:hypothetical protein